ncbi:hypothetical protein EROM_090970 [Encephalitozoon romaleae SJ-2008]|uniref:Autophagy-related protein 9 n=1 Tax=Encephalitozoon romaleae (strain SJ-2008) TaxID=1178016 RepID=I6ZKB7_ENCRO|nr:hypothetical protein EROM_090970 [Encephalitozoon romaleae SJ-2008]AFN83713.1 hypothetical protein EROM_090970 [Encephalitozoon romaleae SJ-2008]
MVRNLKRKYLINKITLLDIYNYYGTPLSIYTSQKIRNVFVTASLCLTVYFASNMDAIRNNRIPRLGVNFSSATLVVGGVFVVKEAISYVLNLKKMASVFYIYRYILQEGIDNIRFKDVVEGVIKLEKEVHNRDLTGKDFRDIVNRNNLLLLLMMKKFPSIFRPTCSRFLLYILHSYIGKIENGPIEEINDEMRVISAAIFLLSPIISIFFILYYIVRIIEKSQNNVFYVFKKAHRPSFKYFMAKRNEYPHETRRKIQKGADYLNAFFLAKKRDCIARICSAVSFFLSCLVFLAVYLILKTVLVSNPNLNGILYQDIVLFGKTTNILYLSYFIGGMSCCLRCLSLDYASTSRRRMFIKWCVLMEQRELLKYSENRRRLATLMAKFFVPRIYLFLMEISSPFIVPFQLEKLRRRLERIHTTFNSTDIWEEYVGEIQSNRISILDL